jgi:hypothetical protein
METLWDLIKYYYQKTFNIPPRYIELVSVMPILEKSIEGFGNRTISRAFNVPVDYVEDVLIDFLCFIGWDEDLDLSPIGVYNTCLGNYTCFYEKILSSSMLIEIEKIPFLFKLCKRFVELKKELEALYDQVS